MIDARVLEQSVSIVREPHLGFRHTVPALTRIIGPNGVGTEKDDDRPSCIEMIEKLAVKMSNHDDDNRDDEEDGRTGLATKAKPKTKKPSLYKVLLLNDDYTPMEFVIYVLEKFFNKGREDATRIMLHVHHKGVGICGVYTYEVAETKVTQVTDFARQNSHPLQCTMEKE